ARPDAHLVRNTRADVLEAALPVLGAVPVREPQGRGLDFAHRRDRPRIADRRPGRPRGAAARRHILWTDAADLGGAVRRGAAHRDTGWSRRLRRAVDNAPHGRRAMRRSRAGLPTNLAVGFPGAALMVLVTLALPLGNATAAN